MNRNEFYRNHFASLIRPTKSSWTDPRASIGRKIPFEGLPRRYSCWEAVGPVRELYDSELGPAITAFFNGYPPSRACVYISICMIGKTEDTAAPKVIFSSPDETVRKCMRKHVEQSSIMASDRFHGIKLGDSSERPGTQIKYRASRGGGESSSVNLWTDPDPMEDPYAQGYTQDTDPFTSVTPGFEPFLVEVEEDTRNISRDQIFSTKRQIDIGDCLLIRNLLDHTSSFTRVTAGPILFHGDREYVLTVSHALGGGGPPLEGYATQPTCSIDGLSDDDSDSNEDKEQELSRKAGFTSKGGLANSRSSMEYERDTLSMAHSEARCDNRTQNDTRYTQGEQGGEMEFPESSYERASARPIGTVWLSSGISGLDYALIDVTGQTELYPNMLRLSDRTPSRLPVLGIAGVPPRPVRIYAAIPSSPPVSGTLQPNATLVRLPNSVQFRRMYEVNLQTILTTGDSGSAIINSENGSFYGLIFAGTPGTGTGFLLPAQEVVEHIKSQIDADLSLYKPVDPGNHRMATSMYPSSGFAPARPESVFSYEGSIFSDNSTALTASTQYSSISNMMFEGDHMIFRDLLGAQIPHSFSSYIEAASRRHPRLYSGAPPYSGPWNSYDNNSEIVGLDRDYRIQPRQFFTFGRVLSVFWTEPESHLQRLGDNYLPSYSDGYVERDHIKYRQMVVVKNHYGCSWCLAINTYGRRGLSKPGIDPQSHAAIYMRDTSAPTADPNRSPGLPSLIVDPYSPDDYLPPKSYINFGKIYTVDHNIKVKPVGHFSEESIGVFRRSWNRVFFDLESADD
ncbi:hypothetical protein FQN49_000813 [Arthroderma sp. PD_2]|nr:hypothetical protein FQN49_000813 [Arthroderma sp. PD_2]